MDNPEGACSESGCLSEDLRRGLSPEVRSRLAGLVLQAAQKNARLEATLRIRRDGFKARSGFITAFDLAER